MKRLFLILVLAGLLLSGCGTAFTHEFKTVSLGNYTQTPVCTNTISDKDGYGDFLSKAEYLTVIPGLYQDMVPQGMDSVGDEYLLISAYSEKKNASVLFLVEGSNDGSLIKTVELKNGFGENFTGHVGGVAVTEDYIFLSGSKKMYVVPLKEFLGLQAADTLTLSAEISIVTNASFLNCSGGYLWSGDFYEQKDYKTEAERHMVNTDGEECGAWAAAYSEDNYKAAAKLALETGSAAISPDFVYLIRDKVQGLTVLGDRLILSQSYGRSNDSNIFEYDLPNEGLVDTVVPCSGRDVPVYFLDSGYLSREYLLPPMAEGICAHKDRVCILFESAAMKYSDNLFFLNGKNPTDGIWSFLP